MKYSQERSLLIVSSVMFVLTAKWTLRKIEEDKKKRKMGRARLKHTETPAENVSKRCMGALSPATPYLEAFLYGLQYPCDVINRPDGYIALCMAENKLAIDVLAERLMQRGTATAAFSDSTVYCYNSFLGIPVARQAAAYFIAKRFYRPDIQHLAPEQALASINPQNIGVGPGAAAILNSLFFLLGEEGEACLIPAPYYAAFENDMSITAGIVPFAFHMANPALGPTESELDIGFIQARSEGLKPRFVLISNPNNPLGVIYKPKVVENLVTWARRRNLHTIVDEIYALSTHKATDHGFESVIKILDNQLGDDVHFVWSISKDFGASGLRVGFVYSQNETYMRGLANLNIFSGVSNPIQMVISELLTDDEFVDMYLDMSRERLRASYLICVEKLEEMVIPFVPAEAGMFVYADFSGLLRDKTMEWEAKLSELFISYGRLILTPGESQRERMPGMFRICYSWVSPEVLKIGMERLSRIVAKIRRMDWADLNDVTMSGIL